MSYIIVNDPGNLSNATRLNKLNSMVHDLESLPSAWGSNSTYYFMKDFLEFEKIKSEMDPNDNEANLTMSSKSKIKFNADDLPIFLGWLEYSYWDGFLKLENVR